MMEDLGRRESKEAAAEQNEYTKIRTIRKRWRCEPTLRAGQGSRGLRRSEWAQQLYLEQDIL